MDEGSWENGVTIGEGRVGADQECFDTFIGGKECSC